MKESSCYKFIIMQKRYDSQTQFYWDQFLAEVFPEHQVLQVNQNSISMNCCRLLLIFEQRSWTETISLGKPWNNLELK